MKLALCGSDGKMGAIFQQYFENKYDIIKITHHGTCLNDIIEEVDLVIDFTNATGGFVHGVIALTHNIPVIIGSTGLREQQCITLQEIANRRKVACLLCNNFSVGIRWIKHHIADLKPYFENITIEEAHHKSKLDHPSGTALSFQSILNIKDENITSIRDDSYWVRHTILMENEGERIEIEHVIKERQAYMQLLQECIENIKQYHGFVNLDHEALTSISQTNNMESTNDNE